MTPDRELPPFNLEAEMGLVGWSIIATPEEWADPTVQRVRKECFFQADHQVIWQVVSEQRKAGKPTDAVTLTNVLKSRHLLEEIGGKEYLSQCVRIVVGPAAGPPWAKIVLEMHQRRQLIALSQDILRKVHEAMPDDGAQAIATSAASEVTRIMAENGGSRIVSLREAADEVITEKMAGTQQRIRTHIGELDSLIGGLAPGKMHLIGGRPGMGKSQLLKQMLLNIARQQTPVGLVTIEEGRGKVAENMLSQVSQVHNHRIAYNDMTPEEWQTVIARSADLSIPFFIEDSEYTISGVERAITVLAVRHRCRVIGIDYIQLIDGERDAGRTEIVTHLSNSLKRQFKRHNIAGVVACQLNRGSDKMSRKPALHDLRDSGALEQDGDCIILLHREDYYHAEEGYTRTELLEADVAKNKDGKRGVAELWFRPEYQQICDYGDRVAQVVQL